MRDGHSWKGGTVSNGRRRARLTRAGTRSSGPAVSNAGCRGILFLTVISLRLVTRLYTAQRVGWMFTTIFTALETTVNLGGISHIFVSGRRQFSGQRFCYPKMRQQPPGEGKPKIGPTPKPRGHPRDSPDIRVSKSLSWLLRHGAEKAGLNIRQDGYAKVSDVVSRNINATEIG